MPPPVPPQPPIQTLVQLLHGGQFDLLARQAEECSRRWPKAGPVWHLLGLAHLSAGRPEQALRPLGQAAKLMPGEADIHEHLAIACMQSGRPGEALPAFERCLAIAPGHLGALINAASLANDLGRYPAAEKFARKALAIAAGQAEAAFNLGRALRGQGKVAEAREVLQAVAAQTRGNAVAQNDVGLHLLELGAEGPAETCFRQALALAPGHALAHANLAKLLVRRGESANALAALRRAVELDPGVAAIHANLGGLLNTLRQYQEAEAACRRALAITPRLPAALANLGSALLLQRRFPEAEAILQEALKAEPANGDALTNLGNLLLERKRYAEAEGYFRRIGDDRGYALSQAFHCASHLCDWRRRRDDLVALRLLLGRDDTYVAPFGVLTIPGEDAPLLQRQAGALAARNQLAHFLARPPLVSPESRPARERLRIGYLSADFHDHATMHLLAGVLERHDRQRFAIHLYSYGPAADDRYRQLAEKNCEQFLDLRSLSDDDAAARIAADGIDILVDLKGFTQDSRLAITALRPAPVVVSWLGYPGTLGHEKLADFIIGDPVVTPPEDADQFSERLALMPHCYQPNDRNRPVGPSPGRRAAGLPDDAFVFCNFNQSYKINPDVFDIWCRILADVPGSVLWLLESVPEAHGNLRQEAARRGIAGERLIFAPRLPQAEHLGRLTLADLAIDTDPYASHTTGSDALWAGVPLLARRGNTFASRVASSLLHAANMPELVCETWEEYCVKAVALGRNPEELAAVRAKLAAERLTTPLFDTAAFTVDLERLYSRIWHHSATDRSPLLPD